METNDKKNPLIQGDHSSIAVKDLHNNVDNHTDSHDVISNTTNNNTVNQNSTVIYSGTTATEKLLSQRREEYRVFCEKNIVSPVINLNTRVELDEMASRLQLEKTVTEEIEHSVRMKLSSSGTLSKHERITLDIAMEALRSDAGKDIVDKLVVLADKTEDEEVQFYANLALVVYDFRRCIQRYERKTFDSYWQTFWTFFAYKRSGNNQKAELVLTQLAAWSEYPEDQITMLSGAGCLYDYFVLNGSEGLKRTAIGYLKSCTSFSSMLVEFSSVLSSLTEIERPVYFGNDKAWNLYLRLFGAKEKPAITTSPKSSSAPIPKSYNEPESKGASVYDIAHQSNRVSSPAVSASKPLNNNVSATSSTPHYSDNSGANKNSRWLTFAIIGVVVAGAIYFMSHSGKDGQYSGVEKNGALTEAVDITDSESQDNYGQNTHQTSGINKTTGSGNSANSKNTNTGSNSGSRSTGKSQSETPDRNPVKSQETVTGGDNTGTRTSGNPVATPPAQVSEYQKQLAALNAGDMSAACKLGHMYLDGDGVSKSNKTAFGYFKQAADAGNAEGMYWLGWCYRMGRGTQKDLNLAKKWWTKAAAAGNVRAANDVKEFDTLM